MRNGDIGYQNMSKVILQNRPNVKSPDARYAGLFQYGRPRIRISTPMLGGNDMNVFGTATQGRTSRRKRWPKHFWRVTDRRSLPRWSIANAPKLYRAILDGLEYRGTAFLQCFTTCQPEHGVSDDMAARSGPARSRFTRRPRISSSNPQLGETYQEALDLKGNPSMGKRIGTRRNSGYE